MYTQNIRYGVKTEHLVGTIHEFTPKTYMNLHPVPCFKKKNIFLEKNTIINSRKI